MQLCLFMTSASPRKGFMSILEASPGNLVEIAFENAVEFCINTLAKGWLLMYCIPCCAKVLMNHDILG